MKNIIDNETLESKLLERAENLRQRVQSKIPKPLRSKISPEDILQEVWISAFRTFRPCEEYEFIGWLNKLADTKLVSSIREASAKKRGGGTQALPNTAQATSYIDLMQTLGSNVGTPSTQFAVQESTDILAIVMAGLPDQYAQVIRLKHLEGKSVSEIAIELGTSEPAVTGLLSRGMKRLKGDLGRASKFYFTRE